MRESNAIVSLSGGADSTTLLHLAMAECKNVAAISVYYGQRHKKELECAKAVCKEYNIPHKIVDFSTLGKFGGSPLVDTNINVPTQSENKQAITVVPFRNTFLATLAAAYAHQLGYNTIYMGPTWEDLANYPDCRPEFFEYLNKALRSGGTIHDLEIRTPFINIKKDAVILLGTERLEVDYSKTWTCYLGEEKPCMECDACRERAMSFYLNGLQDPLIDDDVWAAFTKEMAEKNNFSISYNKTPSSPRVSKVVVETFKEISNPYKDKM